jgi:hypothetical protein
MPANRDNLLRKVKKLTASYEVHYLVASLKCYRRTASGQEQEVTVQIYDAGPDVNPSLRYSVMATSDDGKSATGNPDSTIEMALAHCHWNELDKEN